MAHAPARHAGPPVILPITLRFHLYSRSYCHLCDDMLVALHALAITVPYTVSVIDVDLDPVLTAKYDELVPVLTVQDAAGGERTLCHYFLDADSIAALVATLPGI